MPLVKHSSFGFNQWKKVSSTWEASLSKREVLLYESFDSAHWLSTTKITSCFILKDRRQETEWGGRLLFRTLLIHEHCRGQRVCTPLSYMLFGRLFGIVSTQTWGVLPSAQTRWVSKPLWATHAQTTAYYNRQRLCAMYCNIREYNLLLYRCQAT